MLGDRIRTVNRRVALGAGAVALAALVVAVVLLPRSGDPEPPDAGCERAVSLYFDSDTGLIRAVQSLRNDKRISDFTFEDQAHANSRLAARYPDFPIPDDTREFVGPAAPALYVVTAPGVDKYRLAEELAQQLSGELATKDPDSPTTVEVVPVRCAPRSPGPSHRPCGQQVLITFRTEKAMRRAQRTVDDLNPLHFGVSYERNQMGLYAADEASAAELKRKLSELPGVERIDRQQCVALPHPAVS